MSAFCGYENDWIALESELVAEVRTRIGHPRTPANALAGRTHIPLGRRLVVALGEAATCDERHLHRLEVVRGDPQDVDPVALSRRVGPALAEHAGGAHVVGEQRHARDADRADAGDPLETRRDLLDDGVGLIVVVAIERRVDAEDDEVLGVEADVHVPEVVQRAQEQAGGDQQDERDGDLQDQQRRA